MTREEFQRHLDQFPADAIMCQGSAGAYTELSAVALVRVHRLDDGSVRICRYNDSPYGGPCPECQRGLPILNGVR